MKILVEYDYVLTDRDRHGVLRHYYRRRKGEPKIRLRARPGTPAFQAEYEAAQRLAATPPGEAPRLLPPKPGTLRWLAVQYFGSPEFKRLDPATQSTRRSSIESALVEPIAPGEATLFESFPLNRLTSKAVRVLRDRKAAVPEGANHRLKALRRMFAWGVEQEHVTTNPARDVSRLRVASGGYHSWTAEEVAQFEARHPVGTRARLALALLVYTGVRRSDLVTLGRQHVRQGWLRFNVQKGRRRKPITVELPVLPALQAVLDRSPLGDLQFLTTVHGKPFGPRSFGNTFRRWCNEAGLPQCTAHGLRKAGAAIAAENGATAHQLMAIFGWLTIKEAERYTAAAQRRRMAGDAMGLLVRREPE